jgi:hypothetical protein
MKHAPSSYSTNSKWVLMGIFAAGAALAGLMSFARWDANSVSRNWPETSATLVETRVDVVGIVGSYLQGNRVVYQAQAHVRYNASGQPEEGWYPVLKQSSSLEELKYALTTKTSAYVRWNPASPSQAHVDLE